MKEQKPWLLSLTCRRSGFESTVEFIEHAAGLLSQQVWCWGCDIDRPEGNWLLEIGFDRIEPPSERKPCSSVYILRLPKGRCVALRGFGVFYGDHNYGGIFVPRYEFFPRYTTQSALKCPPWSSSDLPNLNHPSKSQQLNFASLTLDLIDWIRTYEVNVVNHLGIEYRRSTLVKWDDGNQPFTPAEEMARAWRLLGIAITEDSQILLQEHTNQESTQC